MGRQNINSFERGRKNLRTTDLDETDKWVTNYDNPHQSHNSIKGFLRSKECGKCCGSLSSRLFQIHGAFYINLRNDSCITCLIHQTHVNRLYRPTIPDDLCPRLLSPIHSLINWSHTKRRDKSFCKYKSSSPIIRNPNHEIIDSIFFWVKLKNLVWPTQWYMFTIQRVWLSFTGLSPWITLPCPYPAPHTYRPNSMYYPLRLILYRSQL